MLRRLRDGGDEAVEKISAVVQASDLESVAESVRSVLVAEEVEGYLLSIVRATPTFSTRTRTCTHASFVNCRFSFGPTSSIGATEKLTTPTRTVVDPFCGWGTVLAVANAVGLDAVGVDCSARMCRKARALHLDLARVDTRQRRSVVV